MKKYKSMLESTQNTRDLGGYLTAFGVPTRYRTLLRSDVQADPSPLDLQFLKSNGITTIIDLRSAGEVERKPNGFAAKEGFFYFNFRIDEGGGIPGAVTEVPQSYMQIADAEEMPNVFRCIANSKTGVMFNCTAGKDRTGVVSAILLLHVGVSQRDIIEDYVLTKDYLREWLMLIHKSRPEIDMRIVTPCEIYIEKFLHLFHEKYGDTDQYFKALGLCEAEIQMLQQKLI